MAMRIIFVAAWTVAFCFGSAVLFGFVMGFFIGAQGSQVNERIWIGVEVFLPLVPMFVGLLGLLLGILGKLPGTRRLSRSVD